MWMVWWCGCVGRYLVCVSGLPIGNSWFELGFDGCLLGGESDQRRPNQEFGLGKTSLVWEKRVSCAQNLYFAFRMLRGPNWARIIHRGLLEDSFSIWYRVSVVAYWSIPTVGVSYSYGVSYYYPFESMWVVWNLLESISNLSATFWGRSATFLESISNLESLETRLESQQPCGVDQQPFGVDQQTFSNIQMENHVYTFERNLHYDLDWPAIAKIWE